MFSNHSLPLLVLLLLVRSGTSHITGQISQFSCQVAVSATQSVALRSRVLTRLVPRTHSGLARGNIVRAFGADKPLVFVSSRGSSTMPRSPEILRRRSHHLKSSNISRVSLRSSSRWHFCIPGRFKCPRRPYYRPAQSHYARVFCGRTKFNTRKCWSRQPLGGRL